MLADGHIGGQGVKFALRGLLRYLHRCLVLPTMVLESLFPAVYLTGVAAPIHLSDHRIP